MADNTIKSPLSKREDETNLAYHKRIVYGKLKDKTLSDYDYTELAPYVYGKDYSCDVSRRMMYGSCKTLELLDEANINAFSEDDIISELENKKIELQKERQRFFDQRREYNKLINSQGRDEYLRDFLQDAALKLVENNGTFFDNHDYDEDDIVLGEDEAVLVLNDWHYGMVTNNVFNAFNTDICVERIKQTIYQAKQKIKFHKCSRVHVLILGDLIHGSCHTTCRVASNELTCDQLMQVSEILAQAIISLSECVGETIVYSTYGNHARAIQNKDNSIHRDNWERIIPWWLRFRIAAEELESGKQTGITIMDELENEFILTNVCGHDVCASHGDLDSVKTSTRLLPTLFNKTYGRNIECILLGDKHHREDFEELGITAMLCGSLCGTDEYANDKRLYSLPSQLLLIMRKDKGIDAEYRLKYTI